MNREIKYRGQRINSFEWVYGYYVFRGGKKHQIVTEEFTFPFEVRPETVGQLTGLKDKHGKEIYEGDIVERNASNGRGNVRGVIIFLEGEFRIEWHGKGQWNGILHIHAKDCEITGNIHSNPELLK